MTTKNSQLYWLLRIHGSKKEGYQLGYSGYSGGIHASCTTSITSEHPWFAFISWAAVNPPKSLPMADHAMIKRLVASFTVTENPSWPELLEKIKD